MIWSLSFAAFIYLGTVNLKADRPVLDSAITTIAGMMHFIAISVLSPIELFGWSLMGALMTFAGVFVPFAVQILTDGKYGGDFLLPTKTRGWRLDVGAFRAIFGILLLAIAALMTRS